MGFYDDDDDYKEYEVPFANAAPFDARFPHTNQTNKCLTYYIDYQKCRRIRGESYKDCYFFKKVYRLVCPRKWIEDMDEMIAKNRFRYVSLPYPVKEDKTRLD